MAYKARGPETPFFDNLFTFCSVHVQPCGAVHSSSRLLNKKDQTFDEICMDIFVPVLLSSWNYGEKYAKY